MHLAVSNVIKKFCDKNGIMCVRGSENDLLSRYKMAADATQADIIVRLTSDTPLLEHDVIDSVVNTYIQNKYDFVSNCYPLPRTFPDGMNVEVFSKEILDEMHFNAKKPSEREHVTFYVLMQPKKFKISIFFSTLISSNFFSFLILFFLVIEGLKSDTAAAQTAISTGKLFLTARSI